MTTSYQDHASVTHTFQEENGDTGGQTRPVHGLPAAVRTNFTDMVTALNALSALISASKLAVSDATAQGYLATLAGVVSAATAAVSDASTHTKLDTLHTDVGTTLAGYLSTLAGIVTSATAAVSDASTHTKLDTLHTDVGTTVAGYLSTLAGTVTSSRVAVNVDSTTTGKLDTLHTDLTTPPSTIYNGKTTVTTAGTRVTLASSQAIVKGVWIRALASNTQKIYVGSSAVSSTNGFQLTAGDAVFLEVANLNTVNIDSDVNGEGVTYLAT